MASKYRNAGQTCVCANRFLVQRGRRTPLRTSRPGGGATAGGAAGWRRVEIGLLINRQALEDVDKLVQDLVTAGAELVLGGRPHSLGGLFYQPTVLKNVTNTMPVAAREIWAGRAAHHLRHRGRGHRPGQRPAPACRLLLRPRHEPRIWRVAEGLEYGMGINEGIISNAASFGGVEESGPGREGCATAWTSTWRSNTSVSAG